MIPPSFLHDLLTRSDIVTVVGHSVQLKKAGINYKGLCPFHGEKSPSFVVSPSRQTYHCFGCGVHGNALGFLMESSGLGFVEAVHELAREVGMTVPQEEISEAERARAGEERQRRVTLTEVLARAGAHYRAQLKGSDRAIAYLKGRGLTGEIAARFGLGYAPAGQHALASAFAQYDDPLLVESGLVIQRDEDEGGRRYDRFRDRIMFPIRNVKGEVIGFGGRILDQGEPKYLNSPETPVFSKGRELYGLYEARQALREKGYVLVTEGYMDVVALAQLGFGHAVATLGTACTGDHIEQLLRWTDEVVFSFDGDAAGQRAAVRALQAVLPHATDTRRFRFLFLPPEHDPDSYVRQFGAEAFESQIRQAQPLSRQLVEVAGQDCDLDTFEGRARMIAQAEPLWRELPDGLLRTQMVQAFAEAAQIDKPELERRWLYGGGSVGAAREEPRHATAPSGGAYPGRGNNGKGQGDWKKDWKKDWKSGRRPGGPTPPPGPVLRTTQRQPADWAAVQLLRNSSWWFDLSDADHHLLCELGSWHGQLFRQIDQLMHEHGELNWPQLRELVQAQGMSEAVRLVEADQANGIEPDREALINALSQMRRRPTQHEANRMLGRE